MRTLKLRRWQSKKKDKKEHTYFILCRIGISMLLDKKYAFLVCIYFVTILRNYVSNEVGQKYPFSPTNNRGNMIE